MAKPVTAVNHKILEWARRSSGQTLDQVAAALHKEPGVIAAWEAGDDAPSYPQLEKLAYQIYKRPIAVFFFAAPPAEEEPRASFRTLPEVEIEDLQPDTRLKIRQARSLQLSLAELNDGRNPAERKIFVDLHAGPNASPTETAMKARSYLGIEVKVQRGWKDVEEALKAWRRTIEDKGIYVFKNSFKQKDVSGFCLYDADFPIIYVNNSTAPARQIFTILHELAHILTGTSGVTKRDDRYINGLSGSDRQVEIFCNRFAADCLLPSADFKNALGANPSSDESISRIANEYRVSRHVVLLRLLGLDLVSQRLYEQKVAEWKADYDAKKPDKPGGSYYNTQGAYFGEKFLNLAFGKYYDGKISIEQLANYLNVKVSSVPGIEQLVLQGEGMKPPFVFDCNSFNVLSNYYPDQFPSFWDRFEQSIAAGDVLSCKDVFNELSRLGHNDWIRTWAESYKEMFLPPTTEEAGFVAEIFKKPHFIQLVGKQALLVGQPVADPFIIASARIRGGCVVTEEQFKPNAAKIPNVCDHFKIDCTNVEGFLKLNGWKF